MLAQAEAETYQNGPLLRGLRHSEPSRVQEILAPGGHVFVNIRSSSDVAASFAFDPASPMGDSPIIHARPSEHVDDVTTCHHYPLSSQQLTELARASINQELRTVCVIGLTQLTPDVRQLLGPLFTPAKTALLVDVSMAEHLPLWLGPGTSLVYEFLRLEVEGRRLHLLLFHLTNEATPPMLMFRVLSPPSAGIVAGTLRELEESGWPVHTGSVADAHPVLLPTVAAHVAQEERRFGLRP